LRALKGAHPELAEAVDMHIELVDLYRRVQPRVPLPSFDLSPSAIARSQTEGRPLLRFEEIPLEITDLRLLVRQTSEVLHRFGSLDEAAFHNAQTLGREDTLLGVAGEWYRSAADHTADARPPTRDAAPNGATVPGVDVESLGQVIGLAMRPYLTRCAEVLQPHAELDTWRRAFCALCGGEPEMAVVLHGGLRHLVCGRCTLRWAFDASTCPFCSNDQRARITSFATPDGRYRVDACGVCQRYLKSFDRKDRPLMPMVDAVAMLPLDAAAMQRGYTG
jgi:hypothetical protein